VKFKKILMAITTIAMIFTSTSVLATPTTIGGHGFEPAFLTVSTTKFTTPVSPSAGSNIFNALIFSLPKPFGHIVILSPSPATNL
jgi:hypothetical protein